MNKKKKLDLINETMENVAFMNVKPNALFDALRKLVEKVEDALTGGTK